MNDLKITKLCAEAMGLKYEVQRVPDLIQERYEVALQYDCHGVLGAFRYDPLREDVQAMALVKKFQLMIYPPASDAHKAWRVIDGLDHRSKSSDLNRAICECVAEMQDARGNIEERK